MLRTAGAAQPNRTAPVQVRAAKGGVNTGPQGFFEEFVGADDMSKTSLRIEGVVNRVTGKEAATK